jgi:hypothetical protein
MSAVCICISILTLLLAGTGAFGPYLQYVVPPTSYRREIFAVVGFWYIFAAGEECVDWETARDQETCRRTVHAVAGSADGMVSICRTELDMSTSDGVSCKCLIAAAALAVIAFLLALLAAFAACIPAIRRFGVVLSGIGAFFALVSFGCFVAATEMDRLLSYISAGWPCEGAAFVFFVIQAILFMRVGSGRPACPPAVPVARSPIQVRVAPR